MDFNTIKMKQKIYNEIIEKLPKEVLEEIEMKFFIEFTHNSTSIGGNELTLEENRILIEDGASFANENLYSLMEVINNHTAYHNHINHKMHNRVNDDFVIDEDFIENIHSDISHAIIDNTYRVFPKSLENTKYLPPCLYDFENQMNKFFENLKNKKKKLNCIEYIAWTHAEFLRLQPFDDGCGRTARILLNYQLMETNLPPISISNKDKKEYFSALDEYSLNNDFKKLTNIIYTLVENRLDEYINLVDNK